MQCKHEDVSTITVKEKIGIKLEKLSFVSPVTTRTNK